MSRWKDTDNDDEEQEEAFVTFGLVRTDLVEILAYDPYLFRCAG